MIHLVISLADSLLPWGSGALKVACGKVVPESQTAPLRRWNDPVFRGSRCRACEKARRQRGASVEKAGRESAVRVADAAANVIRRNIAAVERDKLRRKESK